MDISSLVTKGSLIKSISSLSGISGVSVGSWYSWSDINFHIYQRFLKKFITIDTPKGLSDGDQIFSPFEGINDGCFKKFFPNLSIAKYGERTNSVSTSKFNPPTSLSSGSATGCTVMQLGKDVSNDKKFVFESQTLVKNEKIGIVVQGVSKNVKLSDNSKDESKLILQYTVLFLENVSDNWSVKWGASLDEEADNYSRGLQQVNIKSPDGSINETFGPAGTDSSIPKDWKYEYYLGIWEEGNSGKSVFEDVVVVEHKNKASILGNKSGNFGGTFASGTHLLANNVYDKDVKKWVPQTVMEFGTYLTNWFQPFKNKKGKWIDLQSYCKFPNSNLRNLC